MDVFEELGIPSKYLKKTSREERFDALVHKSWLKSIFKHQKLIDFVEKPKSEAWNILEKPNSPWVKVIITVNKKRECKVVPLPKIRPKTANDENPLFFPQLMQYISQSNFKNLWKEAYKKYGGGGEGINDSEVTLLDYNQALREVILRTYGCPIVNAMDPTGNTEPLKGFDTHPNVIPVYCAIETLNAIFIFHIPYLEHTLADCVTFSPAVLDKCYSKPLFVIYQLIWLFKSMHDQSLTLGDITLNDIYLNDDLWLYIFPHLYSNLCIQQPQPIYTNRHGVVKDCRRFGHTFERSSLKCQFCGIKTYDKVQVQNESLEELCNLWIERKISNYTYISFLNKFSGRKLGDPNCHYVFPWVTDFASKCGKNWRDLKKSKYRLNKGDRQLDLTYENAQTQVPHHVSDVLSSITYYVYMARRTPKTVLCKNVRPIWVPAEYPSSIQRMQEWTPDECIPEFFIDPSIFRSIHDDLEDLEVPQWASGPEEFIERHREALESEHVSERLHHWIDLTFGYKLSGNAAIKAKNVCLNLADDHTFLTKSGIVQLFFNPHPSRAINTQYFGKLPPKLHIFGSSREKQRSRDRNSHANLGVVNKSDEEENLDNTVTGPSAWPTSGLSKYLSRSRSSLHEETDGKPNRSPSATRSASLGPKNSSFTSHVASKSKPNASLNTGIIYLPKDYKPEQSLETLEKRYNFISKTFHVDSGKSYKFFNDPRGTESKPPFEDCLVQNAFTNFIYAENFEEQRVKNKATKSHTFPIDNYHWEQNFKVKSEKPCSSSAICKYSQIITQRRIKELQILGCLIVEIFFPKQLRSLGSNTISLPFPQRLKNSLTIVKTHQNELPPCVSYIINILLQPEVSDLKSFSYPPITDIGLPPPSANLLLQPILHQMIPFPKGFPMLYKICRSLKEFRNIALELQILYHFDCDGNMCEESENIERTKILFAQNIAECKVKICARQLEDFLKSINPNTDNVIINILMMYVKELIEDPPTSVLALWYLFDPISRMLGPKNTSKYLLNSILRLYDNEPTDGYSPYTTKIAKLYHHSFLLRLIVRLGLKCFLDNFVTPLVEAVGGYKDYDQSDFCLHTHTEKVTRKTSHLKNMDADSNQVSLSDESSPSSEKPLKAPKIELEQIKDEELFDLEEDKESEMKFKSLIEHLELNVASDLPFNISAAEEALDATLPENLEEFNALEEDALNFIEDQEDNSSNAVISPTIPIPISSHNNVINISCEIGSRKSESDSSIDKKFPESQNYLYLDSPNSSSDVTKLSSSVTSNTMSSRSKKNNTKISEMSVDSIIWLSHRLGPVLMAKYLSRNLLKMLTLCYVGKENLIFVNTEEPCDTNAKSSDVTVTLSKVVGDKSAANVLECLANVAALYGEKLIIFQYLPHMTELLALCKRKLTQTLEGGLISCLALLKHIIPYLNDATLMDHLQDILSGIMHPIVRLLGSTKHVFPSGFVARNVLARKYVDTLFVLSIRIGSDMTRKYLGVPALQRFFYIFDKVYGNRDHSSSEKDAGFYTNQIDAQPNSSSSVDFTMGGKPIPINNIILKEDENSRSSSPGDIFGEENIQSLALQEIKQVFSPELAHMAYVPFLKHVGSNSLDISLKNHDKIRELCQLFEQEMVAFGKSKTFNFTPQIPLSSSVGSNINLIGNRIDIQGDVHYSQTSTDLLSLVSNKMENNSRHLKGNWLSYWAHEIGRPEKDTTFQFNQIKLQTFVGHTNSIKSLHVLDNENSFLSGSRDKTVKLWSLRSQGDGTLTSPCQWTYSGHKKTVLSLTFVDSLRLVASCDSVVHLWDPFMGALVGQLESPKFCPVNVVKSTPSPSSLIFSATTEGSIKIIDGRLASYVYDLKISINPSGLIRCLALGPSGTWVAAGQSSGSITVLDTRTGLVISSWRAHEGEVLQIVAVSDETLVSSSLDQTISVWNISDGRFKHHMRAATEPAHCLHIYEGAELISATTANRIGVHTEVSSEASYSSTKLRPDTFKGLLTSMGMLPLNRLLLLGAENGQISLFC
ncbi:WD repeat-containing protein 81 isoform X2 [Anthonomus grandis grandis]|uniref:WD repeat-containing protein 81 isoform X2 n=1 Tax=Anthonomus grandis grandis TaxID=2921223 RepID=UPI0021650313|nr:WD repeat-containing protein 81 isoform X2 [Anthonomus grandis grandis]